MKSVLVTYADEPFAAYQSINALTGRLFGFDVCHLYGPADIDADFRRRNAKPLSATRGAGYWLWKPYLVAKTLAELDEGDVLFYADAAMHFVNPIDPMVERLDRHHADLLIAGQAFTEAQFTKRDAFVLIDMDKEEVAGSPHRFASCFMLRKSAWSQEFVARYLAYAEDERILTDQPNVCGLPNYEGFSAHRHDQSIFSLLSKRYDSPVLGEGVLAEGMPERGRQIINHTRLKVAPHVVIERLLAQRVITPGDLLELSLPG